MGEGSPAESPGRGENQKVKKNRYKLRQDRGFICDAVDSFARDTPGESRTSLVLILPGSAYLRRENRFHSLRDEGGHQSPPLHNYPFPAPLPEGEGILGVICVDQFEEMRTGDQKNSPHLPDVPFFYGYSVL